MSKYFAPLIRWWWLILFSTCLAGGSSYYAVSRLPLVYEVRATLVIGRSFTNPNPNSGELYLEQQLATIYANLGTREQIASATMKSLDLKGLPEYFVRTVPNTPLIEIIVSDVDPARAVVVANELANQLIQFSPSGKEGQDQARLIFVNDQLSKIQTQIQTTEKDIAVEQEKLGNLSSARQIADTQTLITALQQKLISLQSNYSALLSSTQGGAVNNLALVQEAQLPGGPVGPNKMLYIGLAAALGLVISSAAAYGLELMDNSYRTAEDVAESLAIPILGKIPSISRQHNPWTFTSQFPRSPVADAFRILRTNLEFSAVNKPLRSILVVGPDLSMGKSVIATNLALIFSQGEKKIVLMDGDLRRPKLNSVLNIEEKPGITDICLKRYSLSEMLIPWQNHKYQEENKGDSKSNKEPKQEAYQPASDPPANPLYFLPSGTIPPNPAELLASTGFDHLLIDLTASADIVILDSPPLFLPDASIMLGKVDGAILVIELGRTTKKRIKMALDQIDRSGAKLCGIVLNRSEAGEKYYSKYRFEQKRGEEQPKQKKTKHTQR